MDDDRERPTDPPRRPRVRAEQSPSEGLSSDVADGERADEEGARQRRNPSDSDQAETPPAKKRWRVGRWLLAVLVVVLVLIGVAIVGALLYWDVIARAVIVSQANAHGIQLEFVSFDVTRNGLSIDHVDLSDAKLSMASMPGVEVTAKKIGIDVRDFEPKTATIKNVSVTFAAAPTAKVGFTDGVVSIEGFEPKTLQIRGIAIDTPNLEGLVDLSSMATSKPFASIDTHLVGVELRVGHLASSIHDSLYFLIDEVRRAGDVTELVGVSTPQLPVLLLPMRLESIRVKQNGASLDVTVPVAPELSLSLQDRGHKVVVALARVPADLLANELGWSRPPSFALSATATITLPDVEGTLISGSYEAVLEHYVPPHPRELDGILFGDATKATGTFTVDDGRLTLPTLVVEAGELKLKGKGTADVYNSGHVNLTLDGAVPCADLASSAVGAHLGFGAALITGELARGRLTGSVAVHLSVAIEGRDAAHPKVEPAATVRCGLSL